MANSPLDLQMHTIQHVTMMNCLAEVFVKMGPDEQLSNLVWKEMRLLAYFSKDECDVLRDLHLKNSNHRFLSALAKFHIYHFGPSGNNWWWVGKRLKHLNTPSTNWDHIQLPAVALPYSDFYQHYAKILFDMFTSITYLFFPQGKFFSKNNNILKLYN